MRLILLVLAVLAGCKSAPPAPDPAASQAAKTKLFNELANPPRQRIEDQLNDPPSAAELARASYGAPPDEDHAARIRATMDQILKDPDSAKYSFGAPAQGWLPRYLLIDPYLSQGNAFAPIDETRVPRGYVFGWAVPFTVNAKNGYGGYTGAKGYKAVFRDGQLIAVITPKRRGANGEVSRWDVVAAPPSPIR